MATTYKKEGGMVTVCDQSEYQITLLQLKNRAKGVKGEIQRLKDDRKALRGLIEVKKEELKEIEKVINS